MAVQRVQLEPRGPTFNAWVWEPPYWRARVRGLSNATLFVSPGKLTMKAKPFYRRFGGWDEIDYEWPTVVVDTVVPIGGAGFLFQMPDGLARCAVRSEGARLRTALTSAGFAIVEWRHWGWEAPRPVPPSIIGDQERNVPGLVVAYEKPRSSD